jgi:DNA (cytosine-5)-methyltransferase 1
MRLLDMFCGAGGCSVGYRRAGFDEIVGVDLSPQPRYPFEFVRGDAIEYLAARGREFDAVHASPPCQCYSPLRAIHPDSAHPDLVGPTRKLLKRVGRPYVIENVPGAPLYFPVTLCGSMFGLTARSRDDGIRYELRRHRLFETSFHCRAPRCRHRRPVLGVYGHGGGSKSRQRLSGAGVYAKADEARRIMGIDWMTMAELSQAIPPVYTEFIGRQLVEHLTDGG